MQEQLKQKRYNFLCNFFNNYQDINIDLKIRLLHLLFSNDNYNIIWTDYTNNKILSLIDEGISGKYDEYNRDGLIMYHFNIVDFEQQYTHLQINFYNADLAIDKFMKIFDLYFRNDNIELLEEYLSKEHSYFHNGE